MELRANNVNDAYHEAIWQIRGNMAVTEDSRNGPVRVMKTPVTTTYMRPEQRVLFNQKRDANPVFHLIESIWMLAGRNDVDSLLPFNSGYGNYADNGIVHGAYGYRWRYAFGFDQIQTIISILRKDQASRQAVMQMWDGGGNNDLEGRWKDRPCNTHIYFDCRGGKLNMTVCCRSNDMVWGAYGANVVHFSMLQELIAWGVGVPMGVYRQFSNNFHVYTELPLVKDFLEHPPMGLPEDAYNDVRSAQVMPMFHDGETVELFLEDCESLMNNGPVKTDFMHMVSCLKAAYLARKAKVENWGSVLTPISPRNDWKIAFNEWVARRDNVKS